MAKKKKDTEELTFTLPVKKSPDDVKGHKAPSFYISDTPLVKSSDKFTQIREAVVKLEAGKCLIVSNDGTGLTITDLQKRIINIVFSHKRKYVEKDFSTAKVDHVTIQICRLK